MSEIRTNADRAARALDAVWAYKKNDWSGRERGEEDADELYEAVGDLLCDLHHLTDAAGLDAALLGGTRDEAWPALLDRGDMHYQAERDDEAED
jgi:hypothetical protein